MENFFSLSSFQNDYLERFKFNSANYMNSFYWRKSWIRPLEEYGDTFMEKRNKIIFILIIVQPIIDLLTSLLSGDAAISVGAVSRTLLMACLFIYSFRYVFAMKKGILWMYIGSFVAIFMMMIVNIFLKQNYSWFTEINFAIKTGYYLVMIYISIILIDHKQISKELIYQATKIISLIIGSSYWLAFITKTSMNSYSYEGLGYSGWFYSANELSVTVIILLGLTMINLTHDKTMSALLAFISILSMLPMIGTKTAFYGGIVLLSFFAIYLLFTFKIRDKLSFLFFSIIIIFICLIPLTPIASNTEQMDLVIKQEQESPPEITDKKSSLIMSKILSSRNIYFQNIKEDYIHADGLRKAFGLGYAGDYTKNPKLIEMDFFDMFFSYGFIGTCVLLMPLIYLCRKIITFPVHMNTFILLLTICLCFGIAFLAGHVLFAPSVMTYIALLFLATGKET